MLRQPSTTTLFGARGASIQRSTNRGSRLCSATRIAGSGAGTLPDFSDTAQFPVMTANLFLPGISSYEFLIGQNTGLTYIDPVSSAAVDQNHGGSSGLTVQGLGCRDCHTAASSDPFSPPQSGGFNAGAMETLVPQRGGVNTATPIVP